MSVILTDKLTYLHKGFLNYEWRQATFVLYSNGMLAKLKETTELDTGKHKQSVDLKNVVKLIQTQSAVDYVDCYAGGKRVRLNDSSSSTVSSTGHNHNLHNQSTTMTMRLLSQLNVFSHAKTKSKLFNSIFDCNERMEATAAGGKDAMLMLIPFKESSRKKWVFLFMDGLRLQEWLKNINKWAAIPRIEIDFISLKDYKGYRDFAEETCGEIVEFARDDNSTQCSMVSDIRPCEVTDATRYKDGGCGVSVN